MLSGQELLDYLGEFLTVTFDVIDNLGMICKSCLMLRNTGNEFIPKDDWVIFMFHLQIIVSDKPEFNIDHVNGGLFRMMPTEDFSGLKPGESFDIAVSADDPVITRYSVLPKWYVAHEGFEPRLIRSTDSDDLSFVKDFDTPAKWKKGKCDKNNPYTPQRRFERYNIQDRGFACKPVLPTLLHAKLNSEEQIDLSKGSWVIACDVECFGEDVKYFSDQLKIPMQDRSSECPGTHFICITEGEISNSYDSDEAYGIKLNASRQSIEITAFTSSGVFYAIQTIISLLEGGESQKLPSGAISDAPRFPHRGLQIDVSRNFTPTEEVIKLIKVISMYKMNKLHLHLTDDEGWRIEIKDLPELTDVGGKRDHQLSVQGLAVCPTLGSGPDYKSSGSGFYSVDDYQNILREAERHHVEVIPEIDMPGHCFAAVVSMRARYNKYKEQGDMKAADEYRLVEVDEKPSYLSDQMYTGNTMNPCVEGTKRFVEKIITTLKELHAPIQPLKTFHVGGDEVPVGAWNGSPLCKEFYDETGNDAGGKEIDQEKKTTGKIQEYFMTIVEKICKEQGLQLAVWNDGIHDPTQPQESDNAMLVNAWRISQKTDRHNPYVLANSGYKVVLSSATHTYFDHPYEPDPEEIGLHWCVRQMDTRTVFGMKPFNMYACQEKKPEYEHEELRNKSAIIGIQAQVWRELIRTNEMLEYMLFPRLLALAERGWHEAEWESDLKVSTSQMEDWTAFANTVGYKELRRLERSGIHYRIPPPGISIDSGKVLINSVYPGLRFKSRRKGDKEWKICDNTGNLSDYKRGSNYVFTTSSLDDARTSRDVIVAF